MCENWITPKRHKLCKFVHPLALLLDNDGHSLDSKVLNNVCQEIGDMFWLWPSEEALLNARQVLVKCPVTTVASSLKRHGEKHTVVAWLIARSSSSVILFHLVHVVKGPVHAGDVAAPARVLKRVAIPHQLVFMDAAAASLLVHFGHLNIVSRSS